ncbi:phosphoethanolamine transferase [Pseudoduganella sp. GCM10020061]|uniref:phosphoethanolamine transferase n=1 Tax=Pseudoduganella sp. GCM10020061 TaxID=3317345 RepID=UPI0036433AB0
MDKLASRRIDASALALAVALLLASAYNAKFWATLSQAAGGWSQLPVLAATFLIVVLVFNAILTLATFRYLAKPAWIVLVLVAAVASHFVTSYGIVIDKNMLQNVAETDFREASELLSWDLAATVVILGAVPAWLIARTQIRFPLGVRGLLQRAGIASGSLLLAGLLLVCFFKSLAPVLREHRELRFLLIPTNVVQAVHGYAGNRFASQVVVAPLGRDARKAHGWAGQPRRTLTVIVVGETARAANFSLNGYARDTNPQLARQEGLINFRHVSSCGTATAVSVPCVFSALGREGFTNARASSQEGLLDILAHAGFEVLWRDNNSGCKGVCDRVRYEDMTTHARPDSRCNAESCYDELLLDGLPELLRRTDKDLVVVLHQQGSHGPAYAKRYPPGFGRFGPVCTSNQFAECSRESIEAAYDNTILYTDHFLDQTIRMLREAAARESVDTAMLYFSDHGESLGENNMYLHGAPYLFAPREQTEVPMMLWMSDGFSERFQIDRACLKEAGDRPLSHDNVFHSVLGMLGVDTVARNPRLDLFASCRRRT